MQGQFRTLMEELEHKLGKKLPLMHKLVPWLVRHVGWQLTKFQPHAGTGKTSWEQRTGQPYKGEVLTVGETALLWTSAW